MLALLSGILNYFWANPNSCFYFSMLDLEKDSPIWLLPEWSGSLAFGRDVSRRPWAFHERCSVAKDKNMGSLGIPGSSTVWGSCEHICIAAWLSLNIITDPLILVEPAATRKIISSRKNQSEKVWCNWYTFLLKKKHNFFFFYGKENPTNIFEYIYQVTCISLAWQKTEVETEVISDIKRTSKTCKTCSDK